MGTRGRKVDLRTRRRQVSNAFWDITFLRQNAVSQLREFPTSSCCSYCGGYAALLRHITDEAMWNLYTWGYNSNGQLGLGEIYDDRKHLCSLYYAHPTRVWSRQLTHRVADVMCGATFTVCSLENGKWYGFGTGDPLEGPHPETEGRRNRGWFGGKSKESNKFKDVWFSPRPLVLNFSKLSIDDLTSLLRDSDDQCARQKKGYQTAHRHRSRRG